ncbi:hypothetical protein HDU86_000902 [Geranomyces michiganensis]|nr:hypothetical protein HDU86_000902 [Geranomyces michiganensis]
MKLNVISIAIALVLATLISCAKSAPTAVNKRAVGEIGKAEFDAYRSYKKAFLEYPGQYPIGNAMLKQTKLGVTRDLTQYDQVTIKELISPTGKVTGRAMDDKEILDETIYPIQGTGQTSKVRAIGERVASLTDFAMTDFNDKVTAIQASDLEPGIKQQQIDDAVAKAKRVLRSVKAGLRAHKSVMIQRGSASAAADNADGGHAYQIEMVSNVIRRVLMSFYSNENRPKENDLPSEFDKPNPNYKEKKPGVKLKPNQREPRIKLKPEVIDANIEREYDTFQLKDVFEIPDENLSDSSPNKFKPTPPRECGLRRRDGAGCGITYPKHTDDKDYVDPNIENDPSKDPNGKPTGDPSTNPDPKPDPGEPDGNEGDETVENGKRCKIIRNPRTDIELRLLGKTFILKSSSQFIKLDPKYNGIGTASVHKSSTTLVSIHTPTPIAVGVTVAGTNTSGVFVGGIPSASHVPEIHSVTEYGLESVKEFRQAYIGFWNQTDDLTTKILRLNAKLKNINLRVRDDTPALSSQCFPLVSNNPRANPYSKLLTGVPAAQVRKGLGFAVSMNVSYWNRNGITYKTRWTKTATVTHEAMYQITDMFGTQTSVTVGKESTDSETNSYKRSIMQGLETTFGNTREDNTARDDSAEFLNKLGNNTESTRKKTIEDSIESSFEMEYNSNDKSCKVKSLTISASATVSVEADAWFVKATASGTIGAEKYESEETCKEQGKRDAMKEVRNHVESMELSDTTGTSNENQNTIGAKVTTGTVDTRNSGNTNSRQDTEDWGNEVMKSITKKREDTRTQNKEHTKTFGETFTTTNTIEVSIEEVLVPPNTCRALACHPKVIAITIPWLCTSPIEDPAIIATNILLPDMNGAGYVECTTSIVDCEEINLPRFSTVDTTFLSANDRNSLVSGAIMLKDQYLQNTYVTGDDTLGLGDFKLYLDKTGNLILYQKTTNIWETGIDYLENYEFRLRTTDAGHIVQEAKGLTSDSGFGSEDWVITWASSPEAFEKTTIGVPGIPNEYKIILNEKGFCLWDSQAVKIWCGGAQLTPNRFGFKHPQDYYLPTNMITAKNERRQSDLHNDFEVGYKTIPTVKPLVKSDTITSSTNEPFATTAISVKSRDVECFRLLSNTGIETSNKRYKLVLETTGNLVFKDGTRTMWQSRSGGTVLDFTSILEEYSSATVKNGVEIKTGKRLTLSAVTEGPFNLQLSETGQLIIVDAHNYVIWETISDTKGTGPYTLELLDQGRIRIKDSLNVEVWQSWPDIRDDRHRIRIRPDKVCYNRCEDCAKTCPPRPPMTPKDTSTMCEKIRVSYGMTIFDDSTKIPAVHQSRKDYDSYGCRCINLEREYAKIFGYGYPVDQDIYKNATLYYPFYSVAYAQSVVAFGHQLKCPCRESKVNVDSKWSTIDPVESKRLDALQCLFKSDAEIISDDYRHIVNKQSGMCVTIGGGPAKIENGRSLMLWDCNGRMALSQLWKYNPTTETYTSKADPLKCIRVGEGDPIPVDSGGRPVYTKGPTPIDLNLSVWDCAASDANSIKWARIDEAISLSADKNMCMVGGAKQSISMLAVCDKTLSQKYVHDFYDINIEYRPIVNADTRRCIRVIPGTSNMYKLESMAATVDCTGKDDQQWLYDRTSHTIKSKVNNKMCLDSTDVITNKISRSIVSLRDCQTATVKWVFVDGRLISNDDLEVIDAAAIPGVEGLLLATEIKDRKSQYWTRY